jgi:hypothetical protein
MFFKRIWRGRNLLNKYSPGQMDYQENQEFHSQLGGKLTDISSRYSAEPENL